MNDKNGPIAKEPSSGVPVASQQMDQAMESFDRIVSSLAAALIPDQHDGTPYPARKRRLSDGS